jgi:hypothetical protein
MPYLAQVWAKQQLAPKTKVIFLPQSIQPDAIFRTRYAIAKRERESVLLRV